MIDVTAKKILIIDLEKSSYEVKSFTDLNNYLGGVGLGLKLYEMYKEKDPLIFSVGPLNGFFPFCSKTAIVLNSSGAIEDIYIGGGLSLRIKFAGLDAVMIYGKAEEPTFLDITNTEVKFHTEGIDIQSLGLPGKRSFVQPQKDKVVLDDYFTTPENFLEENFASKNLGGFVLTGTEIYKINNFEEYNKLYNSILAKKGDLSVDSGIYPSCSNCPQGCGKSRVGEIGGNILIHSLVACQFADKIYTDIGIVFSCLNVLGYSYTHEDIEKLPELIEDILRNL